MTTRLDLDPTTKASVLLEALPYIQRFRDCIFVIKYGGAFMDTSDESKKQKIASDIAFLHAVGIKVVLVHGGGKAITQTLKEKNIKSEFKNGLRVTNKQVIKVVDQVLNNQTNPSICESIQQQGADVASIDGKDIFICKQKLFDSEIEGSSFDLGYVGDIYSVKTKIIKKALSLGKIPVISPLAVDEEGAAYNTNADSAACKVAVALKARRLVYLCDVPGLMRDIENPESLISSIQIDQVDSLIENKIISSGMIPKVQSAQYALVEGVKRVHFIHAEQAHSLLLEIFTDQGIGTEIVNAEAYL
ncbi:MAG: acetylglutamate kinase [Coraliomargaritaceae bacterium]